MSALPQPWVRALDAAGVVAVLSSIPLWSAVHPASAFVSLGVGATVALISTTVMQRKPRSWGWLPKLAGIGLSVSAVAIWLEASPILAIPGFAAGLVMVVFATMIAPARQTGAHFARFTMESTYGDGRMVEPPQENVLDPLEGDDGRFLGR